MSKTRRLCLYLHTHWDREWYLAFEEYRTQLTLIVDEILKELESGLLPSFMLDGQSCVLEDLQEVDPDLTARISKLMAAGKVEAGPWYVLADQLLVSGESLMRNLEMGLAVTRRFGQPSMIGYCPDTFGHSRDLPRILQSFGITTAIVWRGVPELDGKSLFWWASSDGSKVLTYHLSRGYYQTAFFEDRTAENMAEHLLSWRTTTPEVKHVFDSVLVPVGGDHLSAPPAFTKQLQSARLLTKMESLAMAAESREASVESSASKDADPLLHPDLQINSNVVAFQSPSDDHCLIEANSLRRFVELMLRHAGSKGARIPTLDSELRDNDSALQYERAYMLQGVLSARLYLKRENRLSEMRLARVLEPAFALLHSEKLVEYPTVQLNYAWRLLMQNHPHDSICGCSVDEVHREMMHRTGKFHQVLNVLERRAVETLYDVARAQDETSVAEAPFRAVLNSPILVDPDSTEYPLVLFNLGGAESRAPVPFSWCEPLPEKFNGEILESKPFAIERRDFALQQIDRSVQTLIFTGTNQIPETKRVIVNRGWIAPTSTVPALGYRRLSFKLSERRDDAGDSGADLNENVERPAAGDARYSIDNGLMTVSVDSSGVVIVTTGGVNSEAAKTTYVLDHKLKDVADGGDTYNFDPVEGDTYLQAKFIKARAGSIGPLVKSILLDYELELPDGLDVSGESEYKPAGELSSDGTRSTKSRSTRLIAHKITTEIELRKSLPIVFFETRWENHSRDHRLEVFLETGKPVRKVLSENHFSVIERDCNPKNVTLPVPKGTEAPLDRYPCQRFLIANGQAFFNLGLPEFGASDSAVSITLLRAISALSRADLRTRGGGAGPPVATPEANCLGWNKVNYGWAPLASAVAEKSEAKTGSKIQLDEVDGGDDILPSEVSASLSEKDVAQAAEVALAYELCEQFETLNWTAVGAMASISKSFFQLDSQAVRVVSIRVLPERDFIEFRLLNTSMQLQLISFSVSINHSEALVTTADGRVMQVLDPLSDEDDPGLNLEMISCAPDGEDFIPHAAYKLEIGVNALVSIRLRLQTSLRKPRAGA